MTCCCGWPSSATTVVLMILTFSFTQGQKKCDHEWENETEGRFAGVKNFYLTTAGSSYCVSLGNKIERSREAVQP